MNDIYNRKDEEFSVIGEVPESLKLNDPLYKEGFQAGAASRDAEVQRLQMALADAEALELGTAEKRDQLRAELVKALAACKVKDEALNAMLKRFGIMSDSCIKQASVALAIQPDDAALKAWLGAPVAWTDLYGNVIRESTKEFSRNSMTAAYSIALYSPNLLLGETK